ncbi:M1-specific T cell receptor alpha chain-like, partial [Pseudorasbora parva]|uniref:M1-specific T cell receptor alpha chain-like n=1 Tax=Pseudorasbora parva TaxID=51549 RepID=UPI00351F1204
CVTFGANKIIFGEGTILHVEAKTEKRPEIYKFDNSCLATDFTSHSAVNLSGAQVVRYSGKDYQNYYSSFALGGAKDNKCQETGDCKEGSSGQSSEIEKDEKVNFLSLGLFWLRILFLKTVVFNVLMTFKAWMS